MTESLAEALPREIQRNQELLVQYGQLPDGAGAFASTLIRADIDAALRAQSSGDVVAMIEAHQRLAANE